MPDNDDPSSRDTEDKDIQTCMACGGAVFEDDAECPECGHVRQEFDPDDPYAQEDAQFRFE